MLTFQGVATPTLLSILAGAGGIAIAAGTAADMLLQTSCPSNRQCSVNTNINSTVSSSFSPRSGEDAATFSSTPLPATQYVRLLVEITSICFHL